MFTPNRWYYLRHPDGFTEGQFNTFVAGCNIWIASLNAYAENWQHLESISDMPRPTYEFGAPELSKDRKIATLPLGGDLPYGAGKYLEDEFPKDLWGFFPWWFLLDMDTGRKDQGWFKKISWTPLHPNKEELRDNPFYKKPPKSSA